ncbi:methionyl-tRNA formyltransferase [Xylella fastidiosa]|uniref:methionyl-tRNA formyltransferase n=1 Tax=Xylella fastidiosa TaxID=2371 RepID=UPI0003D3A44C|nr:methionyl-tRNA formyltransferase [Xylella fastidiosa]ALR04905.1 methionyl-tRNA formyltransferase [Xylella fastidiosa]KXB21921.1 methionyl-tRNA formyltransferase [Xylella fastidiosa]OJZ69984.1 methionyl-tRNA formyltransferase [Xylella fastidiosa 6c]
MRIVFAGTPDFAVPSLRSVTQRADVVAVYTQPDRPAGRGRELMPSPVKLEAVARGLPVYQPQTLRSPEMLEQLRALRPDLIVVVAYGVILPEAVLAIPDDGCWNVHASLLPRWRGAAPIQRAIEAGDTETGVCLMQMEAGLDTGPVLMSLKTLINAHETSGQLHDRLAEMGAQLLSDGLGLLRAGLRPVPQLQLAAGVTYAHKLGKVEAQLDWEQPAERLACRVRAFQPWPVAEVVLRGERVRIHEALALDLDHSQPPGTVLAASKEGIDVACVQGALRLCRLQREGGKAITAADYLNARRDLQVRA